MRILVLAYAALPNEGSEPGVGWAWIKAASRLGDVTAIVCQAHANVLREAVGAAGLPVTVVALSSGPFERISSFASRRQYLHYLGWLFQCARFLRKSSLAFDVAHHVTYATDWLPSPVGLAPATRRIWGPVGGASYPKPSDRAWWTSGGWKYERRRRVSTSTLRRVTLTLMRRGVSLAVGLNDDTAEALRRASFPNVLVRPNAGLELDEAPASLDERDQSRVLYLGRVVEWKGIKLAIDALAASGPDAGWQLHVVGSGDLEAWAAYARRAGVDEKRLIFTGPVERTAALRMLRASRCLLLPGWHDSSPSAAAEAASFGIPVVCLDRGGTRTAADLMALPVEVGGELPLRIAAAVDYAWDLARETEVADWSLDHLTADLRKLYGSA